jgi:hypothetical protein
MKKTILLLLFFPLGLFAQMHDNFWVYGIDINPYNIPNGFLIHFENGYPEFSIENVKQYYGFYCAICSDSSGALLFHTNGRAIRNRLHQIMENGDTINPGYNWTDYPYGYPSLTGGFALPAPGFENRYYLLHTSINNQTWFPYFPILYQSVIDMNANNGLGKVLVKNDTLATGDIPSPVAIKHGNGRDWWLILGDYLNKKYQTFLVDPGGIHFMFDQNITPEAFSSSSGYHLASPDGRYFVNNDDVNGLWIYDFDRCSGVLGNPRVLPYQPPVFWTATNAFSSDSRFLYAGTHLVVYQLDMQSIDDPVIAFDTIARYEYGASPAPPAFTHFLTPQLAPDNKVYYSTFSLTDVFHVLHQPNFPLLASDFSQRSLVTPYQKDGTRCFFPSYRLGRLLDSPCDTLPFQGDVEARFQHTPYNSFKAPPVSEVRTLQLPEKYHFPAAPDPAIKNDNPLLPANISAQRKKQ